MEDSSGTQKLKVGFAIIIFVGRRIVTEYAINIDACSLDNRVMKHIPFEYARYWDGFKRDIDTFG